VLDLADALPQALVHGAPFWRMRLDVGLRVGAYLIAEGRSESHDQSFSY
jgi:hypothetical protein